MSLHLPESVALLALSITTLAVVLVGIERSRARRPGDSRSGLSNDTFASAIATPGSMAPDDGCDDVLVHCSTPHPLERTRPLTQSAKTGARGNDVSPRRWRRQCRCISQGGPFQAIPIVPSEDEKAMVPVRTMNNKSCCCHCCCCRDLEQARYGHRRGNDGVENVSGDSENRLVPHGDDDDGYGRGMAGSAIRSPPLGATTPFSGGGVEARRSGAAPTLTPTYPAPNSSKEATSSASSGRRLELLLHNVSHKDLALSLRRTLYPAAVVGKGTGERYNAIDAPDTALARPKFSRFKASSEIILQKLVEMRKSSGSEPPPAVCAVYRRGEEPEQEREAELALGSAKDTGGVDNDPSNPSAADNRENHNCDDMDGTNAVNGKQREQQQQQQQRHRHRRRQLSVGFDLDTNPIPVSDLAGYRVRSRDLDRLTSADEKHASNSHIARTRQDSEGGDIAHAWRYPLVARGPGDAMSPGPRLGEGWRDGEGGEGFITGVYFPLLSVLMPRWLKQLAENGNCNAAKMILLVSGVGKPRSQEHRVEDNSTEVTAVLMEAYLKRHYPDVRVVRLHSNTNIFRYDDNIRFVKTELLPFLETERSRTAERYGSAWQDMMHVTMSFADGSPARISSIKAALRPFRPSFIHIWELKTFWHEKIICEDDVEVHTFDEIDMLPPIPAPEVDPSTALVIAEMLRLKEDWERVLAAPSPPQRAIAGRDATNDLASFWLRKTKKPVLAVLLVQKKGCQPKLYRGTNMEVSMPTGSLCAERNVIGSALSDEFSLLRREIKAVAVLSLPRLDKISSSNKITASAVLSSAAVAPTAGDGENYKDCLNAAAILLTRGGGGRSLVGLTPAAISESESSMQSRNVSPFEVTPTLTTSPTWPRRLGGERVSRGAAGTLGRHGTISFWDSRDEDCREGGGGDVQGVAAADKKRLEGVPQELFAAEPEDRASKRATTEASPHPAEALESPSDGQQRQKTRGRETRTEEEDHGAIVGPRSTNPRFRSKSCEPLVSRAKSKQALEGGGDGESGRSEGVPARQIHSNVVARVPAKTPCSNPLKPCGACMEWLKKIAEVNPDFKVITFTDSFCSGVYIENVAQVL